MNEDLKRLFTRTPRIFREHAFSDALRYRKSENEEVTIVNADYKKRLPIAGSERKYDVRLAMNETVSKVIHNSILSQNLIVILSRPLSGENPVFSSNTIIN